ncbi:hypothetical protein H0H92_011010 [Tricholoma furcatifolium]|nr:hypothetical protein H0H92_011010 [Tricholoma furcatifolium]
MADGTLIALKTFCYTETQPPTEEHIQRFFFEALVTATARHRNIMPILGIHVDMSRDVYLVSKFQKYGILPDYLAAHRGADRLLILEKLADALVHLHSLSVPVLHGDIRGMNVLVDDEGEPLLIDFGLSLVYDSATETFLPLCHRFKGHPRWTPQEKMGTGEGDETFPLTLKADSFSFASLIYEVLSNDVPYSYLRNESAVILEVIVRNKAPKRPMNVKLITDALWDFMNTCWSRNPNDRPSMEDIHRFLKSMRLRH